MVSHHPAKFGVHRHFDSGLCLYWLKGKISLLLISKGLKHNMNLQIQVRSLKKYSAETFTNAFKTVQFLNYNIISNVNVAYSDLLNKISDTIYSVAPIKEIRIKNEIAEAIKIREKYFKKLKKSNLQIDYNVYIEVKYNT